MGLRERLRNRPRPTTRCLVAVEDTDAAEQELAEATAALQLQLFAGAAEESEAVTAARQRVEDARAALNACFETIVFTAMPPEDFETLLDAHPPRPDTDEEWNDATFPLACFLACAPDVFTAEEWQEWLRVNVNDGERIRLTSTAIRANTRVLDTNIPKDWIGILD